MKKSNNSKEPFPPKEPMAITEISVCGYKSVSQEETIEIRPLTVLAGANSAGKSSMMQPLLLLKQTLEAPYDPGPLLLNGPNLKFTSVDQFLSRTGKRRSTDILEIGVKSNWERSLRITFRKKHGQGLVIDQMRSIGGLGDYTLFPTMTHGEIRALEFAKQKNWEEEFSVEQREHARWQIVQERCFLRPELAADEPGTGGSFSVSTHLTEGLESLIPEIIHLPALRGNPERSYPVTAVGATYPGTFEKYTASVVAKWAEEDDPKLQGLNADLVKMGLTGGVLPHPIYETQIELQVSRLPQAPPRKPEDRINIADVGFGVSQTLPVLVALRAAKTRAVGLCGGTRDALASAGADGPCGDSGCRCGARSSRGSGNAQFSVTVGVPNAGCRRQASAVESKTTLVPPKKGRAHHDQQCGRG